MFDAWFVAWFVAGARVASLLQIIGPRREASGVGERRGPRAILSDPAVVAKLADALDSGSSGVKPVEVQFLSAAILTRRIASRGRRVFAFEVVVCGWVRVASTVRVVTSAYWSLRSALREFDSRIFGLLLVLSSAHSFLSSCFPESMRA